jgi:hypothetical protein
MKRRERKLFSIQACLFGRDLLSREIKEFDRIQEGFDEDGLRKIENPNTTVDKSSIFGDSVMEEDDDPLDDFDDINLDSDVHSSNQNNVFNCLVIKKDSSWKGMFDILMLFISCYNIFGNAYYSAFGAPSSTMFLFIDYIVEF